MSTGKLRAFRNYVHLTDTGHWGANYLLFFQERSEPRRIRVVVSDSPSGQMARVLWSEVGRVGESVSSSMLTETVAHRALLAQLLPPEVEQIHWMFLGWYRELTFVELIPQGPPDSGSTPGVAIAVTWRMPVNSTLSRVTCCIPHPPPFWEASPKHVTLQRSDDETSQLAADENPHWVPFPAELLSDGTSVLSALRQQTLALPGTVPPTIDVLLAAARAKLDAKPGATLEELHASDVDSLLPARFQQRLELILLARLERADRAHKTSIVVSLDVNEMLFGQARGGGYELLGDIPLTAELFALPIASPLRDPLAHHQSIPFDLELTIHVAHLVSTTRRIQIVGDFWLDGTRGAIATVVRRGGTPMQTYYLCSDPLSPTQVFCAIATIQPVLL